MEQTPSTTDREPLSRRTWPWVVAILALGLLVRLGWGLSRPADAAAIDQLPDQRGYVELAANLLRGVGLMFVDDRFGPLVNDRPFGQRLYAARTGGYPAFVAACGSVRAVRVTQALLDTSTALAACLLARRLVPGRALAPPFAAALVAFNPFLVYFSALLLTETLYTAMLAWGMVLLTRRRRWAWLPGVVLLVLAVHVRPAGVALPVALAACAAFVRARPGADGSLYRPRRTIGRAVISASLAAALTFAALLPWALRNESVLGRKVWSTSNDGITAYDGFNPGATGASDQSFVTRMPHALEMGELERSDYFAAEAKRFARENPGRVAALTAAKVARTWSPVPLSDEFGRPLYKAIALAFALPFDLLVIAGLVVGRLKRSAALFVLMPALYFTAVHALSVGSLRYRVPAEPALAVVAAAGAARLLDQRQKAQPNDEKTAPS